MQSCNHTRTKKTKTTVLKGLQTHVAKNKSKLHDCENFEKQQQLHRLLVS